MATAFVLSSVLAIATVSKNFFTSKTQIDECETKPPTASCSLDMPPAQKMEHGASPPTTSRFLDLPPELRLAVYAYFIPPEGCACAGKYLRRVCRQIHTEFDSEIARQMTIRLGKSLTSAAPFRVLWQVHRCDSPLQLSIPISILTTHEYYDRYQEKWPDASNSFTYRLLCALPAYVSSARVTFEDDRDVSEWYASYQIQKVKSAILSYVIDRRREGKCDLRNVELYWGDMVQTEAGRRLLACNDKRPLPRNFSIMPGADGKDCTGYGWKVKASRSIEAYFDAGS